MLKHVNIVGAAKKSDDRVGLGSPVSTARSTFVMARVGGGDEDILERDMVIE